MVKTITLSLFLLFFLSGCASFQDARTFQKGQAEQMAMQQTESIQPIIRVEVPEDAFIVKSAYEQLPEELNVDVQVSFKNTDIKRLMRHLSQVLNINFISDVGIQGDKRLVTINYSGKLRDFLAALSDASGYLIFYRNGTIVLKDNEVFSVVVPHHPELLKEVAVSLERLGGTGISYDRLTSSLTFTADKGSLKRIKDYLDKLKSNAALVKMRIIIARVRLAGERNLGVDWTRFTYGYGTLKAAPQGGNFTGNVARQFEEGVRATFSQTGASLLIDAKTFSISALINFLENYGKTEVVQNIFVETLSGTTGKIDVSTETPYIKSVAISPLVGAAPGAVATTIAQAQADVAKTGVVLEITPHYNAMARTLGVDIDAGVYGVTRFIDLSAGLLGILTQPEVAKKQVSTYLRMAVGQIAVIGGLTHNRDANTIAGLPIDTYLTKTRQTITEREELVIVVKPTIVEFVKKGEKNE
jgi:type II secretory pathway component GspD/PulD (secretin)